MCLLTFLQLEMLCYIRIKHFVNSVRYVFVLKVASECHVSYRGMAHYCEMIQCTFGVQFCTGILIVYHNPKVDRAVFHRCSSEIYDYHG